MCWLMHRRLADGWMDGLVGGGWMASSPMAARPPGRGSTSSSTQGLPGASRRSPSRPARPPFLPPVHPPPDPTHQPSTSPQTLTRWTMHLLKTTRNIILQCWLSTQPREPVFEKMLCVCGHGGGWFKRLIECRHQKRYFQ